MALETGGLNAALENGSQDTDFVCVYVCMLRGGCGWYAG